MRSTEEISILLQQYLLILSSSRTLPGSSPAFTLVSNSANLVADHLAAREAPYGYHQLLSDHLYDFWRLRLAPGPPNFFGSVCLGSPARRYLL